MTAYEDIDMRQISNTSVVPEWWLVETFGAERAATMLLEAGGGLIYVPNQLNRRRSTRTSSSFLSDDELEMFMAQWSGTQVRIPVARQRVVDYLWWVVGLSIDAIASRLHIDRTTVQRLKSKHAPKGLGSIVLPSPGGSRGRVAKVAKMATLPGSEPEGDQFDKTGELIGRDQVAKNGDLIDAEGADDYA